MKDNRKSFTHQRIVTSNNDVLHFDGKFNPDTKTMKVYRMYGDVRAFDAAYEAIGIEYGCEKVLGY